MNVYVESINQTRRKLSHGRRCAMLSDKISETPVVESTPHKVVTRWAQRDWRATKKFLNLPTQMRIKTCYSSNSVVVGLDI